MDHYAVLLQLSGYYGFIVLLAKTCSQCRNFVPFEYNSMHQFYIIPIPIPIPTTRRLLDTFLYTIKIIFNGGGVFLAHV